MLINWKKYVSDNDPFNSTTLASAGRSEDTHENLN
jgi:hypothetical protein